MKTTIQKMTGIPNDRVPDMVAGIQANSRYLSHVVVPEGNGKSTIVVVLRAPGASKKKSAKKKSGKKKSAKKKSGKGSSS